MLTYEEMEWQIYQAALLSPNEYVLDRNWTEPKIEDR